jgi:putative ABC transport system permease protein
LVAPYVFTTYDRAAAYLHKDTATSSYYLLQLEPGFDANAVCTAIHERVPELDAFPSNIYSKISIAFWMTRTGLGISFGAATLLGLVVGLVMVAQALYALVLDRLGEFGTLKAIGATERQVFSILFVQAISMSLVGSFIGLALVSIVQRFYNTPRAPIVVPWWVSLGSCVLVLVICLVAAMLPYVRIRKVDPMMVLQS